MPHALIIDDTPSQTAQLCDLLTHVGFDYTHIPTQAIFLQALDAQEGFDIIFVDLNLKTMTGYDVLTQAYQRGLDVPMVACSYFGDEMERAQEMGFSAFMSYPLKPQTFIRQLERIMDGEAVWEK